jgi:hypothetical protein
MPAFLRAVPPTEPDIPMAVSFRRLIRFALY